MQIKIKYPHNKGDLRIENNVDIKEVFIKEKLLEPEDEKVSIGFTNDVSSGILEFSGEEIDKLIRSIKKRTRLIKGFKILKE